MDENEKLAMYGLTEVSACDGYSGRIVAFATNYASEEQCFDL